MVHDPQATSDGPTSVMIVDDEQHLRMYLKMVMKRIGFTQFHEASNGQDAVELYKQVQPELVLMDVNMPLMSGLDALKEIMAYDEEAIVVMCSSVAARGAVEQSAEDGAAYYLRKDTPRDQITSIIQDLIDEIWE